MATWQEAEARALSGGTITSDELDEIIAKGGSRTAEESERILRACPEWVAQDGKRKGENQALRAKFRAEEELMVADLRRVGYPVKDTVYELVNTANSYPEAIPVLLDHLKRPYSSQIREGIVRALSVREARGIAGPPIIAALRHSEDVNQGCRWAMANALTIVATRTEREAIKELIEAEDDDDVRDRLNRALKTAAKP